MTSSRLSRLALAASLLAAPLVALPALAAEKVIVLINPNSNEGATSSMAELARMELGDGLRVEGRSNAGAPPLLTTPEDMRNAVSGVVEIGVAAAQDETVAAIIVAAF
ncbi:hydantoin racemase, partial [Amaricoccus sp. HAR-UPW-R2A-40]